METTERTVVKLTDEQIQNCFEGETHQSGPFLKLHRLIFPQWDNIAKLHAFPACSEELNELLFNLFIDFDKKNHPDVIAGGLWMNSGWSSLDGKRLGLIGYTVDVTDCLATAEYTEKPY